ncbi:hypothetical protein B5F40_09320 [Gordonibacter sp. An230]|uniref:dimethyl sulfoxide reductase anchor subunit family protein n=1 Tax=Gordonibacter sp. An230 TaxID=1965592 RepID=UPI000B382114|nr:hypothetical protein [Gordonibacter sp. An230]OUO89868.1 hypothetical protein B5F40_09320 [Gordonibacter sp. An230]
MELQWPLIVFTILVAWSAGLFASQCLVAIAGGAELSEKSGKSQMIAWVVSAVLLVAGGVAVLFHLEHWERIFNGFGNVTSGITQELVAIVVLVIVAIIYLAQMRRAENGVPGKAICVIGIVASIALVGIMAHSYLMAARPAWNSIAWVLYVLGNACVLGPCTMLLAMLAARDSGTSSARLIALVGSVLAVATAVAYAVVLQGAASSIVTIGYYSDPTMVAFPMTDVPSVFAGQSFLIWLGAVVVGTLVPLGCVLAARFKKDARSHAVLYALAVLGAVVGAVSMRVAFYTLGLGLFVF